jgi:hypothetical protein
LCPGGIAASNAARGQRDVEDDRLGRRPLDRAAHAAALPGDHADGHAAVGGAHGHAGGAMSRYAGGCILSWRRG